LYKRAAEGIAVAAARQAFEIAAAPCILHPEKMMPTHNRIATAASAGFHSVSVCMPFRADTRRRRLTSIDEFRESSEAAAANGGTRSLAGGTSKRAAMRQLYKRRDVLGDLEEGSRRAALLRC
jgi:hypothetical protein